MNARIVELAQQAGIHPSNFEPDAPIKVSLEKLAELIWNEAYQEGYNAGRKEAKDVEQSWRDNPDRMGGQFTQDEINRAGEWR